MRSLSGLRFLYVTGKGGVGKSTVAALVARALSREGRRVLLCYESAALGQERLLGQPKVREPAPRPVQVATNFWSLAISATASMQEYSETILKSRRLAAALFDSHVAKGFLHGVPGLPAWAFLGKAWFYADPTQDGPYKYLKDLDTVVVDAPATGDSTDILRVPSIIEELAPRGRLRKDAELCRIMLHDAKQTAILPVTLLEELPVAETEELVEVVAQDLKLPVGPLFLNQVRRRIFAPEDRAKLAGWTGGDTTGDPAAQVIDLAARRARAEIQAVDLVERLLSLKLELVSVPHQLPPPEGPEGLDRLLGGLAEGPPPGYRALRP